MQVRRYEPIRTLFDRPYARALRHIVEGARQRAEDDCASLLRLPLQETLRLRNMDEIELASTIMSHHFRLANPAATVTPSTYFAQVNEIDRVRSLYHFLRSGRQIVQFDANLTSEFRQTDLVGMTVDDIVLPWNAFYLAFDGQDAPYSTEMPLNGCMIHSDEPNNALILTPFFEEEAAWTASVRHSSLAMRLPLSSNLDMDVALIRAAQETDNAVRHLALKDFPAQFRPMAEKIKSQHGSLQPLMESLLNLVGNALLYLTARPDEGQLKWQDGAPAMLVEKATSFAPGNDKARQALVRDGFSQIRFFVLPGLHAYTAGDGSVRPHWRRGHWKRQPYGPRAALRKIIRVRPTLVAGSAADANETGRIHHARAQRRSNDVNVPDSWPRR